MKNPSHATDRILLIFLAIIAIVLSPVHTAHAADCEGSGEGTIKGEANIVYGDRKDYRHCYYTVNLDHFRCGFGVIRDPNCRNAINFGIGWFDTALSILSSVQRHCGKPYFSEVFKEVTIKGPGARAGSQYDLKMKWKRGADHYNPASSWTQTVAVTANSAGELVYSRTVPAQIHSQGKLVASEYILEDAVFEEREGGGGGVKIFGPSDTVIGCGDVKFTAVPPSAQGSYKYRWFGSSSLFWTGWSSDNSWLANAQNIGDQWVKVEVRDLERDCLMSATKDIFVRSSDLEARIVNERNGHGPYKKKSPTLPPCYDNRGCTSRFVVSSTSSQAVSNSFSANLGVQVEYVQGQLGWTKTKTISGATGSSLEMEGRYYPGPAWAWYGRVLLTVQEGAYTLYGCSGPVDSGTYEINKLRNGHDAFTAWEYVLRPIL